MQKVFSLLLLWLALAVSAHSQLVPSVYIWQRWDATTTAKTLDRDFAFYHRMGVHGVCYNAGMDLDKIRMAARIARRHQLEYHAWTPSLTQEGCDSTWYAVNRLGQSAFDRPAYVSYYTMLDPHHPKVVEWLCEQYRRIAQIPEVDYVQLDYIRYADVVLAEGLWQKYGLVMNGEYAAADYCYCEACVSDFQQRTGLDIRRYTDPSKIKEWAQFRCDNVTRCVNAICAAVRAQGKRVSADVFPGPHSHAVPMVRQEWNKWECDMFFPMNYNDFYLQSPTWVGTMTAEARAALNAAARPEAGLVSGLFVCKDWRNKASLTDPEHWGLSPSQLSQAVEASLDAQASGICLFSAESMTTEHWEALHRTLQGRYGQHNAKFSKRKSKP